MTSLAELLAPNKECSIDFVGSVGKTPYGKLWDQGRAVAAWTGRSGKPLAMVLTNSAACVAVLLGAIQAGIELVSIPTPPRGADLDWYTSFVRDACMQRDADCLIVDQSHLPWLPDLNGIAYATYDNVLGAPGHGVQDPSNFRLVQFTSGSTSDPRGVLLGENKIRANILSIAERLELEPGDSACSWLPLSHDMGLIGMLLTGMNGITNHTPGGVFTLMKPEQFLRDPGHWMRLCSDSGTTITASPSFGLEMTLRRQIGQSINLRKLRVLITGAEPIREESLTAFQQGFASVGFDDKAHCPAYGLAEASLAVTMTAPGEPWTALTVEPDDLIAGTVQTAPRDGMSLVGSGRPLEGMEIRTMNSEGRVGEIQVRGPSLLDGYSNGENPVSDSGWLTTNDLGFIRDGMLFIVGRIDDVLFAAGRKVFASDVEMHVGSINEVRTGRVVAFSGNGHLTILAEADSREQPSAIDTARMVKDIRRVVVGRTGIAPTVVGVVGRGLLPMTASGKVRRGAVREHLSRGELTLLTGSTREADQT